MRFLCTHRAIEYPERRWHRDDRTRSISITNDAIGESPESKGLLHSLQCWMDFGQQVFPRSVAMVGCFHSTEVMTLSIGFG
jgi:hypothetical protein